MKKMINALLKPFHAEIHGSGYLRKLRRSSVIADAFETQISSFQKPVDIIFDVGANRGEVTHHYAKAFPGAEIHAFEPNLEFCVEFIKNNPDPSRIVLNDLALADKEGETIFYLNESSDTNSLLEPSVIGASSDQACMNIGTRIVRTTTLETYCAEKSIHKIDILKLDVQGAELSILKGARNLLKNKAIDLIYTEGYFKSQYKEQPLLYDIGNFLKEFAYFLEGIYDPYYNEKFMLWCDAIFLPLKNA